MTETLSRRQEYDPLLDYSADNYPPIPEQVEFFRYALFEGACVEKSPRLIAGPLHGEYTNTKRNRNTNGRHKPSVYGRIPNAYRVSTS